MSDSGRAGRPPAGRGDVSHVWPDARRVVDTTSSPVPRRSSPPAAPEGDVEEGSPTTADLQAQRAIVEILREEYRHSALAHRAAGLRAQLAEERARLRRLQRLVDAGAPAPRRPCVVGSGMSRARNDDLTKEAV